MSSPRNGASSTARLGRAHKASAKLARRCCPPDNTVIIECLWGKSPSRSRLESMCCMSTIADAPLARLMTRKAWYNVIPTTTGALSGAKPKVLQSSSSIQPAMSASRNSKRRLLSRATTICIWRSVGPIGSRDCLDCASRPFASVTDTTPAAEMMKTTAMTMICGKMSPMSPLSPLSWWLPIA
eukprot:scaffold1550_cov245-Pinguiococcus_pyrenoidosus.AAC.6